MFQTIRNAWKIPDVRKKILYTLFIIFIFRVGAAVPVPFLDAEALKALVEASKGSTVGDTILSYFNTLSGGAFNNATLFAMSVTPYINASIIVQLLTVAIPPLERMAKEGEEGRKKLGQITRYATVIIGLIQGTAYYFYLKLNDPLGTGSIVTYTEGFEGIFSAVIIVLTFTAGTAMMMWLGEQINQKGIGNGISILLFAGIVSGGPSAFSTMYLMLFSGNYVDIIKVVAIVIVFLAMIGFIVFMDNAERRIPVQYAKRIVGRKTYGGQSSHIPIKVNMSGVMPIIFASSIISIPQTVLQFAYPGYNSGTEYSGFWFSFWNTFRYDGWLYPTLFFLLIIGFAYFYVTIQYNPIEMANNLRKNSGVIPGIRPGKPTSEFIGKIISKITLIGALFLSVIALLPILLGTVAKIPLSVGGTSIIILVGVALETVRQIESQMLMRHYKGFLD